MLPNAIKIWNDCLLEIKAKINRQSFKTWFKNTEGISVDSEKLVVQVKDQFTVDWLEQHYLVLIGDILEKILGNRLCITLAVDKGNGEFTYSTPTMSKYKLYNTETASEDRHLNPRYTFDNFVVGSSNQFAHAATLAVSEAPGANKYNPLFIYGGVGLGKTHLIQAIGHFVKEENKKKNVIYVTSERFTNEFIGSLVNNTTQEFNRVYKNLDVLLIDDVHFFSGKAGIQSNFFHIFNSLHQKGKQIVLTSDTQPGLITGLTERLLSRFNWGLVVDIRSPDYETRMAILKKKTEFQGIELPPAVLDYIAQNVNSNIRELEGSLIRLEAFSSITGKPFTVDLAREVVSHYRQNAPRTVTVGDIQKKVAEFYSMPKEAFAQKCRTKDIAFARQVAMYISRELTGNTLKMIGLQFGGRDHSTVIHACNLIEEKSRKDEMFKRSIEQLMGEIRN
ncbi:chromosomal replication initiator protein DnaA [bacterium]|nr:chromosomal replication initiator protein DnaA [bacterium]